MIQHSSRSPDPREPNQGQALTELSESIRSLTPLCRNLPQIADDYLLWFYPDEVDEVSAVLEQEGMDSVVTKYIEERRYDKTIDEVFAQDSEDFPVEIEDPDDPGSFMIVSMPNINTEFPLRLLHVMRLEENVMGTSEGFVGSFSQYHKRASIPLGEVEEMQIQNKLRESNILEAIVPAIDTISKRELSIMDVGRMKFKVDWYNTDQEDGGTVVFAITVELSAQYEEPIYTSLTVRDNGQMDFSLFDFGLAESEYEGHDFRPAEFSPSQLRVLSDIVKSVSDHEPPPAKPFHFGGWIGNSFSPDERNW